MSRAEHGPPGPAAKDTHLRQQTLVSVWRTDTEHWKQRKTPPLKTPRKPKNPGACEQGTAPCTDSPEENVDTSPEENVDTSPEENGDTIPATVKANIEGKKQTGWYFCEKFILKDLKKKKS